MVNLKKIAESLLTENDGRKPIDIRDMPNKLYHVTTNYKKVISSGVLLAKSGIDSGGLGGTESVGVSFVSDIKIAKSIADELTLINSINNNSKSENKILAIIDNMEDTDRAEFLRDEYNSSIDVYKKPQTAALMALRLSRNVSKFRDKSFHGIVIFNERDIENKDIGIIEVRRDKLPKDTKAIEGVDKKLGEIRILNDIPL